MSQKSCSVHLGLLVTEHI